jgi:hypothetical protein
MPRILLALAVVVASIGNAVADSGGTEAMRSYLRARAVLDAGVAAIGGAEALSSLTGVTREYQIHRNNPGQGPRPVAGGSSVDKYPLYAPTPSTSIVDYAGERYRIQQRYLYDSAKEWVDAIDVGGPTGGFLLASYQDQIPAYTTNSASVSRDTLTRELRTYPEAMLRAALRRPTTLQWVGEGMVGGRPTQVISFVDGDVNHVLAFDAQTRLPARVEVLSEHPYIGQATTASVYVDYRKTGRLMLPYRVEQWRNDEPTRIALISRIELDKGGNDATFAPPRERVDNPEPPRLPTLTSLGNDVYATMSSDNSMFAVFPEYVVLVEAPRRESYAIAIFQAIRSVAPGKPVKVVSTHFHEDHIAGVRYAVSQGAEIWTTAHAKGAIERTLRVAWTIRPDEYARAPRDAKIHVIDDKQIFEAGGQRIEIAQVGPTEHAEQMLAAFFPRVETLYTADVWDVPAPGLATPGPDSAKVVARVNDLGWKVRRMIPTHGVPATVQDLNRSLDTRAKFVTGAETRLRLRVDL